MPNSRFQSLGARFSPSKLRTSFRRSSSASSRASTGRGSYASDTSSPASTINEIVFNHKSVVDLAEEKRAFASELEILEPRPLLYFTSLEERMGSL